MSERRKSLRGREQTVTDPDRTPGPDTGRPYPDLPGSPGPATDFVVGAEAQAAAAEEGPELTARPASLWGDAWRDLRNNPLFIASGLLISLFVVMAAFPQLFTSFYPGFRDPRRCELSFARHRPSAQHWFGFDTQGCDYYSQVMHGARVSITIGLVVVLFAGIIAVAFGSLAGYYGGFTDTVIARLTDINFAVPTVLGGIVILNVLGHGFWLVALVLVILGWPTMLRLMRSSVLAAKEQDYVTAARALGASDLRIMYRHILPNALSPVIVYGTIYVGIIIALEATLSFLGVGLQLPAISWGLMISIAQPSIRSAPHLLLFPGMFLSVAVFSFIVLGDALRDALDPRLR